MVRRPDEPPWPYWRTVLGAVGVAVVLVLGSLTGHVKPANADDVDCAQFKCVALTFDDGPTPYTDRLVQILQDSDSKATFFLVGNEVAAHPDWVKRVADAGMEIGNHTWEHANMTAVPPEDLPHQLSQASEAIRSATGQTPMIFRTAGGLINDTVLAAAKHQGLADINWDVIPFDWINDANTAATRYMLMTQIKPGSVVLLHDTYSSTVDLVYQFLPVLKANGYHVVTVTHLVGARAPGTSYGRRDNGPQANDLHDIGPEEIPILPPTPSPAPMPNFHIIDIPNQNSGGVDNGA